MFVLISLCSGLLSVEGVLKTEVGTVYLISGDSGLSTSLCEGI